MEGKRRHQGMEALMPEKAAMVFQMLLKVQEHQQHQRTGSSP
jgi:hypothetical protein